LKVLWVWLNGKPLPLTARVEAIQNIVENLVERDAAHIPAFGLTQIRIDMFIELFFG